MSNNALLKDLRKLKSVKEWFDDGFVAVSFDRSNISMLNVYLLPIHGYFKNCFVEFQMNCKDYPTRKPSVTCKTKIFHPNVGSNGGICFSMFGGHWVNTYRIPDYLNGLLYHLNHPNPKSPLSSVCVEHDPIKYAAFVQKAALGEKAKGGTYDFCLVDTSNIKNSVDFAGKVNHIRAYMNRFKIIAKVHSKINISRTSTEQYINKYDLVDLKMKKMKDLYDPIYQVINEKYMKMKSMIDEVNCKNFEKSEEYISHEKFIMKVIGDLSIVHNLEATLSVLSNRLVKTFGHSTDIFVSKFKPNLIKLNEIIIKNLKSILSQPNSSTISNDNSEFMSILSKTELFEKTNKLMLEFLASVEKANDKETFRGFQEAFNELTRIAEDNIAIVKLMNPSQRISQRIRNLPSTFKGSKRSKFFLKELIVNVTPLTNNNNNNNEEEEEGEDDETVENDEPYNALIISNGREFVDFEVLSTSLNSRIEFTKLQNSNIVTNIKSIPFFYYLSVRNLPVIFNQSIFDNLSKDDMVYFASGCPNYMIGLECGRLMKYLECMKIKKKKEDEKSVRIEWMRKVMINILDGDLRRYKDKNFGFYFDDGTRRYSSTRCD